MSARERDAVFVLVHSPPVGPTTWSPVARELERRGRAAVVPSLLGVTNAAAPQWRHAPKAIRDTTAGVLNPLVLVGHSGGGLLLPTIAAGLTVEVAALIFVDSFLPPAGGSVPLAPPGFIDQLRALATDGVLPRWSSWFGENAWRELVPDERLRAALQAEMPHLPLSYFEASVPPPPGWDARPCAYLLFTAEPYPSERPATPVAVRHRERDGLRARGLRSPRVHRRRRRASSSTSSARKAHGDRAGDARSRYAAFIARVSGAGRRTPRVVVRGGA